MRSTFPTSSEVVIRSGAISKALVGAFVLAAALAGTARSQTVEPRFPVADNMVWSMARTGNTLYVGGDFDHFGFPSGSAVLVDSVTGSSLGFPKIDGTIYTVLPDDAGGWYIGGNFSKVGGLARSGLAHVRSDFSVAPWDPHPTNGAGYASIYALVRSDAIFYVGGSFSSIGGQARTGFAAVDTTTGTATSLSANTNGAVRAIAVTPGAVFVGGEFTTISGFSRPYLAKINLATSVPTGWNPAPNASVGSLLWDGAKLYVGGGFNQIGSVARSRLAVVDTATGLPTPWNPPITFGVSTLILHDGRLYAGGFALDSRAIAAVDTATGASTYWGVVMNSAVKAIAFRSGRMWVGGEFTMVSTNYGVNIVERRGVVALDPVTGELDPLQLNSGSTYAFLPGDRGVLMGGVAFYYPVWVRHGLAAIDLETGVPTDWNPNTYPSSQHAWPNYRPGVGHSNALVVGGARLYAGGTFNDVGGVSRSKLASFDLATGLLTSWSPSLTGTEILAIAVDGSNVYVGGTFTQIGGQSRDNLAALDAGSALATAWNPSAGGTVRAIAMDGSRILVGGYFSAVGGQLRSNIAALDLATGAATAWDPNASGTMYQNGTVYGIDVGPGGIYACGTFTSIGGQARPGIAQLDPSTGLATSFNPPLTGSTHTPYTYVYVMKRDGNAVYLAGEFVGPHGYFAAVDATTGAMLPWDLDPFGVIMKAIETRGLQLFLGGQILGIKGQPWSWFFAAIQNSAAALGVGPGVAPTLQILKCRPNPASRIVALSFQLPTTQRVTLRAYDLAGRRVASVMEGELLAPGRYERSLDVRRLTPGIYHLRITSERYDEVRRIVVTR
jgi:hypothetical protein